MRADGLTRAIGVTDTIGKPPLRAQTLANPVLALGMAVNFLARKPAFARLPFGHWSAVLAGQIRRGHYFFVAEGRTVVGFAGWALASTEEAEAWLAGKSDPAMEHGIAGDAMILNAWAASTPEANRFILRHLRKVGGEGLTGFYGKREYPDGRTRLLRLRRGSMGEKGTAGVA